MGETRVDLLHLLEDLRDAYPGSTEGTILTEIVANSLDSSAATIVITTDPAAPALTIVDDGAGMRRRELARYHDVAASAKTRGDGIGFAGVGIKVALLVCTEVVTETRRGRHHVASSWRLASRNRAPWRWIVPEGRVPSRGTAVRLVPETALSPLVDPGFVESVLRRAFQPLFDPALATILREQYPRGVAVVLNGRALDSQGAEGPEVAQLSIRVGRKRRPAAAGYLVRAAEPLPEALRGVAISTFGKVIRRGWDWLGLAPAGADRVAGLIEVPALAESLTLNKADFIRAGARGATYLAYRKAIQEAVAHQLGLWGDVGESAERARRRAARPIERDLEAVLADLADEFRCSRHWSSSARAASVAWRPAQRSEGRGRAAPRSRCPKRALPARRRQRQASTRPRTRRRPHRPSGRPRRRPISSTMGVRVARCVTDSASGSRRAPTIPSSGAWSTRPYG